MSLDPDNRARIVSDIDQFIAGFLGDEELQESMEAMHEAMLRAWDACEGLPTHMKASQVGSQFAHTLMLLVRRES